MLDEALVFDVRVFVDVVYALSVERRRTALDAVDFVALVEQKLSDVNAILVGDAGDECFFDDWRLSQR